MNLFTWGFVYKLKIMAYYYDAKLMAGSSPLPEGYTANEVVYNIMNSERLNDGEDPFVSNGVFEWKTMKLDMWRVSLKYPTLGFCIEENSDYDMPKYHYFLNGGVTISKDTPDLG